MSWFRCEGRAMVDVTKPCHECGSVILTDKMHKVTDERYEYPKNRYTYYCKTCAPVHNRRRGWAEPHYFAEVEVTVEGVILVDKLDRVTLKL